MNKRRGSYGRAFEDRVCDALHETMREMRDSQALESLIHGFHRSGEVKIPYTLSEAFYLPDIVIKRLSNPDLYIEVKSYFQPAVKDDVKMIAVKRCNPDLDIRFVFSDASKKMYGRKMTMSQWADKYGFPWAEGSVPRAWLD